MENLLKGLKEDRSPAKTAAGEERIGKDLKYRKMKIIEETKEDKGEKIGNRRNEVGRRQETSGSWNNTTRKRPISKEIMRG